MIFEKLCPVSTSFIVSPSVIARDISHASLACRKFYSTAPIAWRSLENLIRAEDGKSRATNWTATRELEELELKRLGRLSQRPLGHTRRFSPEQMKVLQRNVPWKDILSNPQLYSKEGLDKANLCKIMQPFQRKSAALQLYFVLRDAAQHVFGLQHPCTVPALILLAVQQEKGSAAVDMCINTRDVRDVRSAIQVICTKLTQSADQRIGKSQPHTVPSAFDFRRLVYPGARNIIDLLNLAADMRRKSPLFLREGRCSCGDTASPACEYCCCQLCCPGPCQRHSKRKIHFSQTPLGTSRSSSNEAGLKRKRDSEFTLSEAFSAIQARVVKKIAK